MFVLPYRTTLSLVVSCRIDNYLLLTRDDLAGMIESNSLLQLEKVPHRTVLLMIEHVLRLD
jgi:hypothetical protein